MKRLLSNFYFAKTGEIKYCRRIRKMRIKNTQTKERLRNRNEGGTENEEQH